MRIIRKPRWALPESAATPEPVFWNRRAILAAGGGLLAAGALSGVTGPADAAAPEEPFAPMPERSPRFSDAGRAITDEMINSTYNNFYEFGSHKQIARAAQALETDGWTIAIDGLVETPITIGADDLIAKMPLEERVYRHRCVEAWSMVVPWIGFPLARLVEMAKPLSGAKYVRFETFKDPDVARGQRQHWYPWPYVEGLTMAEATNELAMMVVGAYGKVLHKQFGAPIRLHLPWKYGFKSIKSVVRVSFVEERPVSFWEELQASEYGFWANVNPAVPHPRWSQADERVLGTEKTIPTMKFNGYGPEVAELYAGLEAEYGERLWR
ncbi:protein-methionine-sulfoxide reductase catalytic subunit MsrP [Limibaculum sp. M0105]|uniref:Protein-methionine-sulfoxide reductase catalytic subunit MsrP n=1 Tax=Thermohalobaculum xanthum TaxID=2753746 RepID=A0A8J7SCV7_9RHOB|nr:protein-methionine-sulfoxide reductase catalytic subunit MsrP [Thermohalobaculum xanthum]MBK0399692.1 protein-methionine-sulfoxide reductase catalytic subunit MsrP [Thermohalobaculum xanthum]